MTTSAIPAALDWLVGVCSNGGITPTGSNTTQVYVQDGPLITLDPMVYPQRLGIGFNGLAPAEPAVEGEQEFAGLGARTRNEMFHITCTAEDWSGDTSMRPRRDNVFALVAQVELKIRGVNGNPGDATMGGAVLFSQISGPMQFHEAQETSGAVATVVFRISAKARLTS